VRLVLDASVVAKLLFPEPDSGVAVALMGQAEHIEAPEILIAELCSVAWKKAGRGDLTASEAKTAVKVAERTVDRLAPLAPLASRAFEISRALNHPPYDCFYLALAEAEKLTMVTADRRLLSAATNSVWGSLLRPLVPAV
jgi:predicted nucleic acid-binding protein